MNNNKIYRRNPAAGGNANKLVVFLHGYGADGKDLIDLANPFGMALPNASFISPDAPQACSMSPQGRQWFPIEEIPNGAIRASLGLLDLIGNEAKKLNLTFKCYQIQREINNKTTDNWIEIIYLYLYKDTYLIFLQPYETLQSILY